MNTSRTRKFNSCHPGCRNYYPNASALKASQPFLNNFVNATVFITDVDQDAQLNRHLSLTWWSIRVCICNPSAWIFSVVDDCPRQSKGSLLSNKPTLIKSTMPLVICTLVTPEESTVASVTRWQSVGASSIQIIFQALVAHITSTLDWRPWPAAPFQWSQRPSPLLVLKLLFNN